MDPKTINAPMSDNLVSPARIIVLLEVHCYANGPMRRDAPVVQEAIAEFLARRLIEKDGEHLHTTDAGSFLVEMLCETPFPTQEWVDPRKQAEGTGRKGK